ncbi:hypothetical protein NPX13_g10598 [Xylaria arbuscula]|uniref:Heterokaryon incompatibility domain-containing protein n=1 Tax=Xylaria arbuscula TaxID=114810 RepID=A0A9W8N4F4_9PEZI|nr:hypothetical protein NPX13_g10598 [Xylaria arbuscula]
MRLINSRTLQFQEFEQSSSDVPQYAILSHTWGDEEVTFRDMSSGNIADATQKKGYAKIKETCRLARGQGLEYVWIDTCCIDKSSSAELSESINSMFKWYEHAAVCYVFLSDFFPERMRLIECRWWTRGWTLQELLAPDDIVFYDAEWRPVGSKESLVAEIAEITRIEQSCIQDKRKIPQYSVSQRMSWAAFRRTTRMEDEAYCLLGIFSINMPLLYGEGRMAFRRLQEEIIKRSSDMTIFFWDWPESDVDAIDADHQSSNELQLSSLFAEAPSSFGAVRPLLPFVSVFPELSITNKGVLFSHVLQLAVTTVKGKQCQLYGFWLGQWYNTVPSGILLRKVGPGMFCRVRHTTIRRTADPWKGSDTTFYIIPDPDLGTETKMYQYRHYALHLPYDEQFSVQRVTPRRLYDATDRVFLHTPEILWGLELVLRRPISNWLFSSIKPISRFSTGKSTKKKPSFSLEESTKRNMSRTQT